MVNNKAGALSRRTPGSLSGPAARAQHPVSKSAGETNTRVSSVLTKHGTSAFQLALFVVVKPPPRILFLSFFLERVECLTGIDVRDTWIGRLTRLCPGRKVACVADLGRPEFEISKRGLRERLAACGRREGRGGLLTHPDGRFSGCRLLCAETRLRPSPHPGQGHSQGQGHHKISVPLRNLPTGE